jgi:hypothetical protein
MLHANATTHVMMTTTVPTEMVCNCCSYKMHRCVSRYELLSRVKLQLGEIFRAIHNHSTALDLTSLQDLFIRDSELRRLERSPLLRQCHICDHEHAQVDLVETDVGLPVIDSGYVGHRVERALR